MRQAAIFGILKRAVISFMDDECHRMSASLAYYTAFSLPGVLLLIVLVAGSVFDRQSVQDELVRQVGIILGPDGAREVATVMRSVVVTQTQSTLAKIIGIITLLFSATGAFTELQTAVNKIWKVTATSRKKIYYSILLKRILSFGMIIGISFLLLGSLLTSTLLSYLGENITLVLPEGLSGTLLRMLNTGIAFVVITLFCIVIFKVLPDTMISWKDAIMGAALTSFLFIVGKELIGSYLGNASVGSAYGVASSLAFLLLWVYFSSVILFLGAELTKELALHSSSSALPEED